MRRSGLDYRVGGRWNGALRYLTDRIAGFCESARLWMINMISWFLFRVPGGAAAIYSQKEHI